MSNPILIANAYKKKSIHRGGGQNFTEMQNDIRRFLKQHKGNDVFFTSMIDLYALHKGFPGTDNASEITQDPCIRVCELEQAWATETNDDRFIPHIQLHEYEAYLFANIKILLNFYPEKKRSIEELHDSTRHFAMPELINEGTNTAPSKRIIERLPQYRRDKTTVGVQAVEQIGLATVRSKCPHFSKWLEKLESLAEPS